MLRHEWLLSYFCTMLHSHGVPGRVVDRFAINWSQTRKSEFLPCPLCYTNGLKGQLYVMMLDDWFKSIDCNNCGVSYLIPKPN